jgi:hypothetical protein
MRDARNPDDSLARDLRVLEKKRRAADRMQMMTTTTFGDLLKKELTSTCKVLISTIAVKGDSWQLVRSGTG